MKTDPTTLKAFCKFWYDPDPNDGYDVGRWIKEERAVLSNPEYKEERLIGFVIYYAKMWNTGSSFLSKRSAAARGFEEVNLDDVKEMADNILNSLKKEDQI